MKGKKEGDEKNRRREEEEEGITLGKEEGRKDMSKHDEGGKKRGRKGGMQ